MFIIIIINGAKPVCGSFLGVEKIQNGHGNQGAKNVKFKPYSGSF
jgi:hypothetical protein